MFFKFLLDILANEKYFSAKKYSLFTLSVLILLKIELIRSILFYCFHMNI